MPFIPLPTADVCNLTSQSSLKIAQTVSRTWYNLDSSLWSKIPERITFSPDGNGELSSPFIDGQKSKVLSCRFTWSLARDGIFSGFEEMHEHALFDTIPKLIRSETAWTWRTWRGGRVPAYLRINQSGTIPFEPDSQIPDPFITDSPDGKCLPPELLEIIFLMASEEDIAAHELTLACRRSREMVMNRRRRGAFTHLAERFLTNGIALWIECGHFDPVPNSSKPPTSFYGMEAQLLKYPLACGYSGSQDPLHWGRWDYHSCKLPVPTTNLGNPLLWRKLHGIRQYDTHPEVEKDWT